MQEIKISEAGASDLIVIQQLAHQIWPITFGSILSDDQMKYMLEMMYSLTSLSHQMQQEHQFILAQYHHVYVGYASYQIHYNGLAATKIHKLYVLPSQHRKGIGKHLLNSISQVALRHENPTLLLNVNKKNPAINFYQKNGFVQIREERILIGNGFIMDDYVMEKKLPDTFSSGSTA